MDEHGQTPLHIAASGVNDIELCKVLLKYDARIAAADENGNQPLHLACKQHNTETVKLMLSHGADPNAVNKPRQTPLHIAAGGEKNCPELCEILLKHHAKNNAVDEHGDQSLVIDIGKGAEVNAMDGKGNTPLHVALQERHMKTAEVLLANGADCKVLDGNGETVLHLLCKSGVDKHELCEGFLSHGVSPCQADREGNLPLHTALKNKLYKTSCLLFKQCCGSTVNDLQKMNIQNKDLNNLLCFAVNCCDAELCQKLLDVGANPNAPNTIDLLPNVDLPYVASMYPLHIAVAKNSSELCRVLLGQGATVNVQMDTHYSTCRLHLAQPLHLAIQLGFHDVCHLLIEQNASINAETKTGASPLHLAIVGNETDIVRLLLCHGAILDNIVIGDVPALEWSAERDLQGLTTLLHDSGEQIDFCCIFCV